MLEYAFFHNKTCDLFCDFVEQKGIKPLVEREELSINVQVPEDLDDELMAELEDYYDELLDMTEQLAAEEEGEEQIHNVGVTVNLSDGRSVLAAVEPALVNKLLDAITMDELSDFVNAIVDAVEHPDERPLCKRG